MTDHYVYSFWRAWALSALVLQVLSCQSQPGAPAVAIPYQLDVPDHTFSLPPALNEISGLAGEPGGQRLMAIQDETGVLYYLDKSTGQITDSLWFWKPGDYEGVEWVGDYAYVVKSSGTLYRIRHTGRDTAEVEKYNTALSSEYDVEGLGYDRQTNELLLACKAEPGPEAQQQRSIFAFSLATHELTPQPVLQISRAAIVQFVQQCTHCDRQDKLNENFNPDQEDFVFHPSALAVHPLTGHWYLLSSVGKTLVVVNRLGEIIHIAKLRKQTHPQPEGIWFDQDGTLYISNEGGTDGVGHIHRFRYEP